MLSSDDLKVCGLPFTFDFFVFVFLRSLL